MLTFAPKKPTKPKQKQHAKNDEQPLPRPTPTKIRPGGILNSQQPRRKAANDMRGVQQSSNPVHRGGGLKLHHSLASRPKFRAAFSSGFPKTGTLKTKKAEANHFNASRANLSQGLQPRPSLFGFKPAARNVQAQNLKWRLSFGFPR